MHRDCADVPVDGHRAAHGGSVSRALGSGRWVTHVALVHDYLTQRGGAERVVLTLLEAFPDAPLYTSFFDPDSTFPQFADHDVRTLPINRIEFLRRRHRLALPLLAPAFSSCHV